MKTKSPDFKLIFQPKVGAFCAYSGVRSVDFAQPFGPSRFAAQPFRRAAASPSRRSARPLRRAAVRPSRFAEPLRRVAVRHEPPFSTAASPSRRSARAASPSAQAVRLRRQAAHRYAVFNLLYFSTCERKISKRNMHKILCFIALRLRSGCAPTCTFYSGDRRRAAL